MKTKEEIFKDLWPKLYIPEMANIETPVYAAMDEYAKLIAIAFARAVLNDKWNIQSNLSGSPFLSDEDIYASFIESTTQNIGNQ